MNDCLFCKIVSSEIPSTKIWESDSHVAFFDIFPNCYGQTLVIPKKHFDSKIFEMPEDAYSDLLKASKKVANLLKKKLQLERVGMIVEGLGVNHVHVKLYPLHGLTRDWSPNESSEEKYFQEYPGYMSSQMGPEIENDKLDSLIKIFKETKND